MIPRSTARGALPGRRPRLMFALALLSFRLTAADPAEQTRLIEVLQSPTATLQQKDAACSRLKFVASERSIPALATLLGNPDLSHSARYVLESMADPQAGEALRQALPTTPDPARIGIVDSLGQRGDRLAIPLLTPFLASPDTRLAVASAKALGLIGGPEAIASLQSALPGTTDPVRAAVIDALLNCAQQLLGEGQPAAARAIFQPLCDDHLPDAVRLAAYGGLFVAAGDRAPVLILEALQGTNGPAQFAGVPLVRTVSNPEFFQALRPILAAAPAPLQVALLESLAQRDDPTASPAVLALSQNADPAVRLAAVRALGPLGDATAVSALIAAATSSDPTLQRAARESLALLHHGPVTETLLAQLAATQGPAQNEIIRALSSRAEPTAVPRLLELAHADDPALRIACLRALAPLASPKDLGALVSLVVEAPDDTNRTEAQRALSATCQRALDAGAQLDTAPILHALDLTSAPPASRAELLQVCSLFIDPAVRDALRKATRDPQPTVRDAASRAICDSRDPALLPDLLTLAQSPPEPAYRLMAVRGYVRLATDPENRPALPQPPVHLLQQLLPAATLPDAQRILLSGLATLPDAQSLKLVLPFLDDPALRAEAIQATLQIAVPLSSTEPRLARAALTRVLAANPEPAQRTTAEHTVEQIDALTDYLTAWEVVGPYREAGKDFAALFDLPFPPETADAPQVTWARLPASTDPARPVVLDLLKALGGEQCVAYVRTTFQAATDQPAILELGTDDGVKAWLNGALVHANNAARPLQVGSDKVPVKLRAGPNTLLLKITQNNLGWEFSARFTQPDGSRLTAPGQP